MLRYRNGKAYCYKSIREGGRVRTEYRGGGELARLADELDRIEAEAVRAIRQHWRDWMAAEDGRSRPVVERAARVGRAVAEALEGAGFHRHKRGEWRRRREAMATMAAEATIDAIPGGDGGGLPPWPESGGFPPPGDPAAVPAVPAVAAPDVGAIERRWIKRPARVGDGEARALLDARPSLDSDNSLSPSFDALASLLDALNDDPVKREASRRKFFEVERHLAGPNPTPTEALLAENAALCWLDLNLRRARTAAAELDTLTLEVATYCQKRIDAAHRRFLAAVKAIALVRKLAVPDLKIAIDQRSVTVASPPPPAIDVGAG